MRNMRKFYITFVSIMTIAIILPNLTAFASFKPPVEPSSESIYMLNIGSDFDTPILESIKTKRQPALVKIMTAILLLEHSEEIGKPLEDITVTVESFCSMISMMIMAIIFIPLPPILEVVKLSI